MPELAFLDRMGMVFLVLALVMVILSMAKSDKSIEKAVRINPQLFKTRAAFNAGAIGICAIVAALYLLFW
jgi:SSS family solute:Na+ symporter